MRRLREQGTALLSVLLLVAVMAAIAATAMDRLGLATRLAGNAASASQARLWLNMAEEIALSRLEREAPGAGAGLNAMLEVERSIQLPDGMTVRATLSDGGNCFNLNSLADERSGGRLFTNGRAVGQFAGLMNILGIDSGTARRIAESTADYIDTDQRPGQFGKESGKAVGDLGPATFPNRAMVSVSEFSRIEGVDTELYELVSPWLCALPEHELSAINVETLRPDQAPLIAMLAPERLRPELVRAHLAGRPASGYGSVYNFWNDGSLAGVQVARQATEQVQVETRHFRLSTAVDTGEAIVRQSALIAIEDGQARRVSRRWGDPA